MKNDGRNGRAAAIPSAFGGRLSDDRAAFETGRWTRRDSSQRDEFRLN
jgi:hypothetical protein